jgi:hypothetical protein
MSDLREAREQVRAMVGELEEIRGRLLERQAKLPVALVDASDEEDGEEPDPASEVHAVIGCAIRDSLEPLIGDLRSVAAEPADGPT